MKQQVLLGLCSSLLVATTFVTHAATVIGINFNNNDPAGSQNDGNFGATWTNIDDPSGAGVALSGTDGDVVLGWASSGFWTAGSWTSSTFGNEFNLPIGMMRVYLDDGDNPAAGAPESMGAVDGDGIGVSVTLVGLADWLTANNLPGYTIRTFHSTDTGDATFRTVSIRDGVSVTDSILESLVPTVQGNGQWDGTSVDEGGNQTGGTRGDAIFASVFTQDAITLTMPTREGSSRGTLAGVVITAIPEPSSVALAALGIFALVGIRRRAGA